MLQHFATSPFFPSLKNPGSQATYSIIETPILDDFKFTKPMDFNGLWLTPQETNSFWTWKCPIDPKPHRLWVQPVSWLGDVQGSQCFSPSKMDQETEFHLTLWSIAPGFGKHHHQPPAKELRVGVLGWEMEGQNGRGKVIMTFYEPKQCVDHEGIIQNCHLCLLWFSQ